MNVKTLSTSRYNSTNSEPPVTGFSVQYLTVAGGGGGGSGNGGGGGGAGGVLTGSLTLQLNTQYTVTIGAGGAAVTSGNNSVFSSVTALKGANGSNSGGTGVGGSGTYGSGGGIGRDNVEGRLGGVGTPGQGYNGGAYSGNGGTGGGGAGGNGKDSAGDASSGTESDGGIGKLTTISGSVYYGGGGGGSLYTQTRHALGGTGGGGRGCNQNYTAYSGTTNTGGGGGGGAGTFGTGNGGQPGGSGIVIIKYPVARTISAGVGLTYTTKTSGSYKITNFTAGTDTITFT